jgi:LPXTG-motif cell wall-anchored protein
VRVALDGVDNGGPQTVSIPATSSRTVTFTAVPCRSGPSTLTVTATATDGSTVLSDTGGPVTLQVAPGSTCTTTVNTPGGTLSITTTSGRVVGLTAVPLAGLPTPPAGLNLPYGAITFRIEDLAPGESVTVRITVPGPATDYAKVTAGGWATVPGTVTLGNGVAVTLTDGGIGDADGLANGVIVDPGAVVAPAQVPPTTAPPSTAPPTTAVAPTITATTVPAGAPPATTAPGPGPGPSLSGLPQTGSEPNRLLVSGAVLAAVGAALLLIRRPWRRPEEDARAPLASEHER